MKLDLEKVATIATVVVTLGGGIWFLSQLDARVANLEDSVGKLAMSPRGESCKVIIQKLVEDPSSEALLELADRYGCASQPPTAIFLDENGLWRQVNGTLLAPDGELVAYEFKDGELVPSNEITNLLGQVE